MPKTTGKRGGKQILPEIQIVALEGLGLDFATGHRKSSVYRGMLEKLLDDPALRNSGIKVSNLKSRYSIVKHARALGCKVAFAELDGCLYAKVTGLVQQPQKRPLEKPATAGTASDRIAEDVTAVLRAGGPMNLSEISRRSGFGQVACSTVLSELVKSSVVERDGSPGEKGTIYRLVGNAAGKPAARIAS